MGLLDAGKLIKDWRSRIVNYVVLIENVEIKKNRCSREFGYGMKIMTTLHQPRYRRHDDG